MAQDYRIGLLGAGTIGSMHAANLVRHPLVGSLVIANTTPEKATRLADRLACEDAPVADVLATSNPLHLDGLVITTGTSTHAELLERAAELGLPTYCEKPISISWEGARAAQAALARSGLPHHIGFQRRFDDGYRAAREALQGGELGELRRFHACTLDQFPPPDAYIPTSGGIFVDCNSHDFDILRWITGREVEEVYSVGSSDAPVFEENADVSQAVSVLRLDDGSVGSVHASRANGQGHQVGLDLMGTKGTVNVGLDEKVPWRSMEPGVGFPHEDPWTDYIARFQPCFEREIDHFLRNPMQGLPGACTADDAVAALRVSLACRLSRAEHRPVRVSEIG